MVIYFKIYWLVHVIFEYSKCTIYNTDNEAPFLYSAEGKRVVMMLIYSYHILKKGRRKDCWKNYSGILTKETYWNTQIYRIAHSQR